MADTKTICVNWRDFDASRLRLHDAQDSSYKKGGAEISSVSSQGRYVDDDGEECILYIELPERSCFGINRNFPMGISEEDKTPDRVTGLQVCYQLTSLQTAESPTEDEQTVIDIFDALWNITWEKVQEECERDSKDIVVPDVSVNSCLAALKMKDPKKAVKPIYSYPMTQAEGKKAKKIEDTSKPPRSYIKLKTYGTGRKMTCSTSIYGPGDRLDSTGLKYVDVKGVIHPVIEWKGIYWGAHGAKSYGASVTLRVHEMNFTPQRNEQTRRRMLGPNKAIAMEDDVSDEENPRKTQKEENESDGEDEGFLNPEDEEEKPKKTAKSSEKKNSKKKIEKEEKPPKKSSKTSDKKQSVNEKRKQILKRKQKKSEEDEE